MVRQLAWVAGLAIVLAIAPQWTLAQTSTTWVGRRVITKFGTVLTEGGQIVDNENLEANSSGAERKFFRVYKVEKADGLMLRLIAEKEGVCGWVKADQVIPYDQAIDYCTSQMNANPSARLYVLRGLIWYEKGKYDVAIADESEAIRLEPSNEIAFTNRGLAWQAKAEYDRAIADENEAIRLDPNYALAYNNRGLAWQAKGKYDKALADYDEAIRLDPNYALAYNNRGFAWQSKAEFNKALADYNKAIQLEPKDEFVYLNRGRAWQSRANYAEALTDYDEAIRLNPNDPSAYNARAWLWATALDAEVRDGKKAVEAAMRACRLSKWKRAHCLGTLAAACAEVGDFDAAVKWQEKASKLYKTESDRKAGRERLSLYKARTPYREQPTTKEVGGRQGFTGDRSVRASSPSLSGWR